MYTGISVWDKRMYMLNPKNIFAVLISIFCAAAAFTNNKKISNGTLLAEKIENNHAITIRYYEQDITIDYAAETDQLTVYDSPISKNVIGNLQQKDRIHISEMYIIDSKDVWLKFLFEKKDGYIRFAQDYYDFYKDDLWLPADIIDCGEKIWHTVKCREYFFIYTNLNIRDKPGLSANKIGMIKATHADPYYVTVFEITEEKETIDTLKDCWAKINYNGTVGWIFGGYLEMESGGG